MSWWCAGDAPVMRWLCADDALLMHCWCANDALTMHWRSAGDAPVMRWLCADDALSMHYWCVNDTLMMLWWCAGNVPVMRWLCADGALMVHRWCTVDSMMFHLVSFDSTASHWMAVNTWSTCSTVEWTLLLLCTLQCYDIISPFWMSSKQRGNVLHTVMCHMTHHSSFLILGGVPCDFGIVQFIQTQRCICLLKMNISAQPLKMALHNECGSIGGPHGNISAWKSNITAWIQNNAFFFPCTVK